MVLLKSLFFARLTIVLSVNLLSATLLKCVSMTNQECKVRLQIVNVNSGKPIFYHFSITSKCSGSVTISMIHMQNCVFLMMLKI